jgi:threonine 3-dehydrogenase
MKLFGHNFDGCFANYTAVPEAIVFKIHDALSLDKAALLEPLGVALQAVEKAQVHGDSIAIIGAGPIGLMSLYLARKMGACFSVVIDINAYRLDLAKKLGADLLLSPGMMDVTDEIMKATQGDGVGRIIEASGSAQVLSDCFFYLRKGGRLVLVGNPKEDVVIRRPIQSLIHKEITIKGVHGRRMFDTWEKTQRFLLDDSFPFDVFVTHEFPMSQFEDAFQLIESGKCAKIKLTPV